MRSLPLFHRIAGQPVIVLGDGVAAEAKRRLVERAGAVTCADIDAGVQAGARIAFVACDEGDRCEAEAGRLREAGLLVNVVDRPDLCDFTVPSLLERDPVLIAVGTSGASAGLAKQLRLRLEGSLPADLGALAGALEAARQRLRERWPSAKERRLALDEALAPGGVLDPLDHGAPGRVAEWLDGAGSPEAAGTLTLTITSSDPDDLTLRQARLLGTADVIFHEAGISPAILGRARADAVRRQLPCDDLMEGDTVLILRHG